MSLCLSNFASGNKIVFKDFSGEISKQLNSPGIIDFPTGNQVKIMFKKFRDSIKRIATLAKIQIAESISPSNFDVQLSNTLFTCVYLYLRDLKVVAFV